MAVIGPKEREVRKKIEDMIQTPSAVSRGIGMLALLSLDKEIAAAESDGADLSDLKRKLYESHVESEIACFRKSPYDYSLGLGYIVERIGLAETKGADVAAYRAQLPRLRLEGAIGFLERYILYVFEHKNGGMVYKTEDIRKQIERVRKVAAEENLPVDIGFYEEACRDLEKRCGCARSGG